MSRSGRESTRPSPRLAILCGSSGGDFKALLAARAAGLLDYRVVSFLSTTERSSALQEFRAAGQDTISGEALDFRKDRTSAFSRVMQEWSAADPEWIALCGFPFLLPGDLVRRFTGRIINSHPSILPAHPGLFRKEDLAASHEQFLGATLHLVDEGMDTGPILAQAVFPNYGMEAFERVLRNYRFVQDVLMVQVFRTLLHGRPDTGRRMVGEVLFGPGAEEQVLDFFLARYELS
jgi:phosphoribosylglycinamide formyltransferase-1